MLSNNFFTRSTTNNMRNKLRVATQRQVSSSVHTQVISNSFWCFRKKCSNTCWIWSQQQQKVERKGISNFRFFLLRPFHIRRLAAFFSSLSFFHLSTFCRHFIFSFFRRRRLTSSLASIYCKQVFLYFNSQTYYVNSCSTWCSKWERDFICSSRRSSTLNKLYFKLAWRWWDGMHQS